ncbi:hypothetical protein B481_2691 [Planococcus halocryophilus Or1]|uniref:Uncharacterized protein n=1 Tax=Planococcus halocryophilus TaxID=1215089 RepID=A0A1C7DNX5_9BACL|nr:hypothetical protein [Planococcus halocryophilus]ANU13279.1 hypothetical protein BBI08_05240 [Planococcus halocryophilus]EMF45851.1 hypothetical protein B481_2691 [Planococcus halocryophilus Or1]
MEMVMILKCRKAESKLHELKIPYQAYNIFEHRALCKSMPIEKKIQGLPLMKIQENYYSLTEILDLKNKKLAYVQKLAVKAAYKDESFSTLNRFTYSAGICSINIEYSKKNNN